MKVGTGQQKFGEGGRGAKEGGKVSAMGMTAEAAEAIPFLVSHFLARTLRTPASSTAVQPAPMTVPILVSNLGFRYCFPHL